MRWPAQFRVAPSTLLLWGGLGIPILVALITTGDQPFFPTTDLAIMQTDLMHAPFSIPPVGVYSRYDFHHPGPALYVLLSPFWNVFGTRGLLIAAALFNIAVLGAILGTLRKIGGISLQLCGAVFVGWLVYGRLEDFINPWNPWIALLPFLLSILLCWACWQQTWWAFPGAVVALSLTLQFHVGYALVALPLATVATVGMWRALHPPRRRTSVLSGIGIGAAIWVLPVAEQFWNWPGNFSKIIAAFRDPAEDLAGWSHATSAVRQSIAMPPTWIVGEQYDFGADPIPPGALTALPFVLTAIAALLIAWKRRNHTALTGLAIPATLLPVGWFSVSRITGMAAPYLIRWVWMIAIALWIVASWVVVASVITRLRAIDRMPVVRRTVVPLAAMVLLVPLSAKATSAELPVQAGSVMVEHTIETLEQALDRDDSITFRLEGMSLVRAGAGIIAALDHDGYQVWWPNEYEVHVGNDRIIGDRSFDTLVVVSTQRLLIRDRIESDGVPVVSWDPLSQSERSEMLDLEFRVQEIFAGRLPQDAIAPEESSRARALAAQGLPIAIWVQRGEAITDTPGSD